jgi:multicomponent K+:H+ antiporter subunit A
MVPAVLVRLLVPMAGLVSLFFLLRGHNLPGGGFIGGLVLATAVIVQYMVGGALWVEARTRIQPLYWIAIGLLAAGTAGIASWFASRTFLTSLSYDLHLPVLGAIHLSTTLWFDIGVYMLVVGATVLMLVALAHQSLRSYRRPAASTPASVRVEPAEAAETSR